MSRIMQMGVAYLWLEDYAAAWEHFHAANQRYPKHSAIFHEMAGAAKWCLDEPNDAVNQWLAGLKCAYADSAGGVRCPLLLFTASVTNQGVFAAGKRSVC